MIGCVIVAFCAFRAGAKQGFRLAADAAKETLDTALQTNRR